MVLLDTYPLDAREGVFGGDEDNVDKPPDAKAAEGDEFKDSKANMSDNKAIYT